MLKVHSNNNMMLVPVKVLQDSMLSLEAKALYLTIWSQDDLKNFSVDLLYTQTSSSIENIQKAYDELINSGYLTVKKDDIHIWMVPQKVSVPPITQVITSETIETIQDEIPFETTAEVKPKKKKLNKWEQIEQLIENYTEDRELRKALKGYFLCRMNPATTSRFSTAGPIQVYQVSKMLEQLDGLTSDKVQVVEYCKKNEYMKFFDLPKPKSFDGVKSESITQDEMDAIRKRWAEWEANGEQIKF